MSERLVQVIDGVRRMYWRVIQPETRGVKAFVLHPDFDSVLLVRNTYGDKDIYTLPGGGVKRSESPEQAARREVRQEVGIEIEDIFRLGEDYVNTAEYKTDTVTTIGARAVSHVLLPNREIAEASWWNIDAIDQIESLSGFAARAIEQYRAQER